MEKKGIRVMALIVLIITFSWGGILIFKDFKTQNIRGNITIWANSINFDYLNNSAKQFMNANSRCKIKVINVQSYEYEDKINQSIEEGNLPNIVQMDSNTLVKLSEIYSDTISIEQEKSIIDTYSNNFNKARIAEVTNKEKLLGIPFTSRPLVLYLRQDVMDQYGYKHEEINTWDKLISMGKDIYEKSGGRIKILNAVGQDREDIISLLIMQYMEEYSNKDDVINKVKVMYSLLERENIINLNENGEFLARISSVNGMRELKLLDVKCNWTANNVPAKSIGNNRFYVAEGNNLVVVDKDNKNSELIRRFIGFLTTNTKSAVEYVNNGEFILSFLSTYKQQKIETSVNNFSGKSPIVIMANITEKAPTIKNYSLYREIKDEFINK